MDLKDIKTSEMTVFPIEESFDGDMRFSPLAFDDDLSLITITGKVASKVSVSPPQYGSKVKFYMELAMPAIKNLWKIESVAFENAPEESTARSFTRNQNNIAIKMNETTSGEWKFKSNISISKDEVYNKTFGGILPGMRCVATGKFGVYYGGDNRHGLYFSPTELNFHAATVQDILSMKTTADQLKEMNGNRNPEWEPIKSPSLSLERRPPINGVPMERSASPHFMKRNLLAGMRGRKKTPLSDVMEMEEEGAPVV